MSYDVTDEMPEFPHSTGCYVLYLDELLAYVGQSSNLQWRIAIHEKNLREHLDGRRLTVKIRYSRKYGDWAMVELRLIRRLKPPYNSTGVGGGGMKLANCHGRRLPLKRPPAAKKPIGFAAMRLEERIRIAKIGGRNAQASGRAHRFTPVEAMAAALKSVQQREKPGQTQDA
jgi:hypothetical protein